MIKSLFSLMTEDNKDTRPNENSWPMIQHFAHIHVVRENWIHSISEEIASGLGDVVRQEGEQWILIDDIAEIGRQLDLSAQAVEDTLVQALETGQAGPYEHPVLFVQHQVWHEGYHAGLIILALRNAGCEPSDEWEESHIWELWRGVEEWE